MMKKALVTGADGFIGRNLVKELLSNDYKVYAVVMDVKFAENILGNIPDIEYIECKMNDYDRLSDYKNILDGTEYLFHFAWAGVSDVSSSDYAVQLNNVKCSCDLQKTAKDLNIKRIIFASSVMEYEHYKAINSGFYNLSLRNTYHISKNAAKNLLQIHCANDNLDFIPVIISNVFGIGENSPRLINTAIRKLLNHEHMSFTSCEQIYDFIYISDAVRAIRLAAERGKNNKDYYIGSQTQKPLKYFLYEMRDIIAPDMELGIGELEFKGISLDYTEFDTQGIFDDFGFIPQYSFSQGIKMTADWIRENEN